MILFSCRQAGSSSSLGAPGKLQKETGSIAQKSPVDLAHKLIGRNSTSGNAEVVTAIQICKNPAKLSGDLGAEEDIRLVGVSAENHGAIGMAAPFNIYIYIR